MSERTFTFIVTEACQLRCKYCYLIGKNYAHKMTFGVARKAIDYIFAEPFLQNVDKVVFDFMAASRCLKLNLFQML